MGACDKVAASTHTFLWPLILLSLLLSACACARAQSCTTYAVQSGDTCYSISQAQGVSLSDFESWNEGIDCDNLQIGQLVCISAPSSSSSSPPSSSSGSGNGKVFREYIGALWNDVTLTSMPVNTNVEVHYILSFAIDYTSDGSSPTNGNFGAFWDTTTITPAAVQAIKAEYPNVKVMLSLGGDTVGAQSTSVQFQPTSVSSWVSNAVSSLTALVQTYGLDGIDIDYEHFDSTTDDDFASAIGQLVTQLKQQGIISVASIAPFDRVAAPYTALWAEYSSIFDYVNFQFYTYGASTTVAEYITDYNTAAATYSGGKVLASFTTADGADSVTPDNALAACQQLQASNSLPGIFVWSADNSFASTTAPGFPYEQQAQALLAAA